MNVVESTKEEMGANTVSENYGNEIVAIVMTEVPMETSQVESIPEVDESKVNAEVLRLGDDISRGSNDEELIRENESIHNRDHTNREDDGTRIASIEQNEAIQLIMEKGSKSNDENEKGHNHDGTNNNVETRVMVEQDVVVLPVTEKDSKSNDENNTATDILKTTEMETEPTREEDQSYDGVLIQENESIHNRDPTNCEDDGTRTASVEQNEAIQLIMEKGSKSNDENEKGHNHDGTNNNVETSVMVEQDVVVLPVTEKDSKSNDENNIATDICKTTVMVTEPTRKEDQSYDKEDIQSLPNIEAKKCSDENDHVLESGDDEKKETLITNQNEAEVMVDCKNVDKCIVSGTKICELVAKDDTKEKEKVENEFVEGNDLAGNQHLRNTESSEPEMTELNETLPQPSMGNGEERCLETEGVVFDKGGMHFSEQTETNLMNEKSQIELSTEPHEEIDIKNLKDDLILNKTRHEVEKNEEEAKSVTDSNDSIPKYGLKNDKEESESISKNTEKSNVVTKSDLLESNSEEERKGRLASSYTALAESAAKGIAALNLLQPEESISSSFSNEYNLEDENKFDLNTADSGFPITKEMRADQSSLSSSLSESENICFCPSPDKPDEFVIKLAESLQSLLLHKFGNVVLNINTAKAVCRKFEFKRICKCLDEHLPNIDLRLLKTDQDKSSFFANLFSLLAIVASLKQGSTTDNLQEGPETQPEDFVTDPDLPLNNLRYLCKNIFSVGQLGKVNLLDLQLIILHRIFWPMDLSSHYIYSGKTILHPDDDWSIFSPPYEPRLIFFLSFGFRSSVPFQILYPESYELQLEMATRQMLNNVIDIDVNRKILIIPPQLCWYADVTYQKSTNLVVAKIEQKNSILDFLLQYVTAYPLKSKIGQLHNTISEEVTDQPEIDMLVKSYAFDSTLTIVLDYHHFSDIVKSSKMEALQDHEDQPFKLFPLNKTDMIFLRNKCPPLSRMASLLRQNYYMTSQTEADIDQEKFQMHDTNPFKNRTESDNGTVFMYVQKILNLIIQGSHWQELLSTLFLNPITLVLTQNEIFELKNFAYAILLNNLSTSHRDFKDTLNSISKPDVYARIILSLIKHWSMTQSVQYLEIATSKLEEDPSNKELESLTRILMRKLSICNIIATHAKCLLKNEIFESDQDKLDGKPDKELQDMKALASGWKSVNELSTKRPGFILNIILQSGDSETAIEWAELWNISDKIKYDMFTVILREKVQPQNFSSDAIVRTLEQLRKSLGEEKCAESCEKLVSPGEVVHSLSMICIIKFMLNELKLGIDDSRQSQLRCILIGLETLVCIPVSIRGPYEELSFDPLLLVEMLLMNENTECASMVIQKFRKENLIPDEMFQKKLDHTLLEYAKRALELKCDNGSDDDEIECDEYDESTLLHSIYIAKRKESRKVIGRNFQVPKEPVKKEEWEADDDVDICPLCKSSFTVFLRRHHCRWCGRVICDDCSLNKRNIGKANVRICDTCIQLTKPYSGSPTSIQDRLKRRLFDAHGDPYETSADPTGGSIIDENDGNLRDAIQKKIWILSTDQSQNEEVRRQFGYSLTPQVELAISIFNLISCTSTAAKEMLMISDQISQLLLPMKLMNHKDFYNILNILRQLLTESKMKYQMSHDMLGVENVDSRLSKVDLILKMIQSGISKIPSIEDLSNPTIVKSLRDRFIAEEKFDLALEVSSKLRLDYSAVWRAWGMYCLEQKDFLAARLKFSKFMKPGQAKAGTGEESLLNQIIEFLENKGQTGFADSRSTQGEEDSSQTALSEEYFDECLYYLKQYGTHSRNIKFYVKHKYLQKAVGYVLERKVLEDTFVETLLKQAIEKQEVFKLQDQMIMFDPTLEKWLPYLNGCCRYLSRNKYNRLLKDMQLFMKDYLRAAMTCIIMYHTDAKTYSDLSRRTSLLSEARHNCEMFLRSKFNAETAPTPLDGQENYRMTMSSQDIHYHMAKIDQQVEVTKILAKNEMQDPPKFVGILEIVMNKKRRTSVNAQRASGGGISTSNCELPSLFGGTQSKIEMVVLLTLTETENVEIDSRTSLTKSLLVKSGLNFSACFHQILAASIKLERSNEFPNILTQILGGSAAEEDEAIKNEVVIDALSQLSEVSSDDAKSETIKRLIDCLKDDEARIKAFVASNQLKSAYLVAVRLNSTPYVEMVAEEAKRSKQMTIKNICERWLLQKSKQNQKAK